MKSAVKRGKPLRATLRTSHVMTQDLKDGTK
jgi:hypothetical protein